MQKAPILQTGGGTEIAAPVFSEADPGSDLFPIAPSDSTALATPARALRVKPVSGSAGTVKFVAANGTDRTTEMAVGELLPVKVLKVYATGTTATGLEGLA